MQSLRGGVAGKVILIAVIVIVVAAIAGMAGGSNSDSGSSSSTNSNSNSSSAPSNESTPDPYADDEVYIASNEKFVTETAPEMTFDSFGYPTISGSIKSLEDKSFSYVQIEFTLYDEDGAQVGTALANINNLDPNGIWKYEAVSLDDGAADFKLADISAF